MSFKDYKTHILQSPQSKKWWGELWIENKLYDKTLPMMSKGVAINQLNKIIERWNVINPTKKIPLYKDKPALALPIVEPEKIRKANVNTEKLTTTTPKQEKIIKPKRKPFTPSGLNGYLVNNQGNVRLMLDRRVNARTIVLNPSMFAALAEMVHKTQEQ